MRVFAVSEVSNPAVSEGELRPRRALGRSAEVSGDRGVVESDMLECLARQIASFVRIEYAAVRYPLSDPPVVGGVDQNQHGREVLGGGADHSGAADVDVLQCVQKCCVRPVHRLHKRIEVAHDHIDGADAVPF